MLNVKISWAPISAKKKKKLNNNMSRHQISEKLFNYYLENSKLTKSTLEVQDVVNWTVGVSAK